MRFPSHPDPTLVAVPGPSADNSPGRASRKRPRLSSDAVSADSMKVKCTIKAEGGVSPIKKRPDDSPAGAFRFEEETSPFSSSALQGSMFDATVEWGDVFDENFSMDASPLPMELGSPPVPRYNILACFMLRFIIFFQQTISSLFFIYFDFLTSVLPSPPGQLSTLTLIQQPWTRL